MPFKSDNQLGTEKFCLAALLQSPEIFPDIDLFVKPDDFTNKLNSIIFGIIRQSLIANEPVDAFLIAAKISNLNVGFEIAPLDYLESLKLIQINKVAARDYFKSLALLSAKRKIYGETEAIQRYLNNSQNDQFDEVVSKCDKIYGDTIKGFTIDGDKHPVEMFSKLESFIEEIGNNPTEDSGIITPYPIYNKKFGGLRNGEVYCWCSRAGQGKSTILTDISYQLPIFNKDKGVKVLYLDTEIPTKDAMIKLAASISGVDFWALDTGNFRKSAEMYR